MKRIAVLGTGQMGVGIAQVLAQTGHEVLLGNRTQDSLDFGLTALRKAMDRLLKKGRITQVDYDDALAHIRGVAALDELKAADLVIEWQDVADRSRCR